MACCQGPRTRTGRELDHHRFRIRCSLSSSIVSGQITLLLKVNPRSPEPSHFWVCGNTMDSFYQVSKLFHQVQLLILYSVKRARKITLCENSSVLGKGFHEISGHYFHPILWILHHILESGSGHLYSQRDGVATCANILRS